MAFLLCVSVRLYLSLWSARYSNDVRHWFVASQGIRIPRSAGWMLKKQIRPSGTSHNKKRYFVIFTWNSKKIPRIFLCTFSQYLRFTVYIIYAEIGGQFVHPCSQILVQCEKSAIVHCTLHAHLYNNRCIACVAYILHTPNWSFSPHLAGKTWFFTLTRPGNTWNGRWRKTRWGEIYYKRRNTRNHFFFLWRDLISIRNRY